MKNLTSGSKVRINGDVYDIVDTIDTLNSAGGALQIFNLTSGCMDTFRLVVHIGEKGTNVFFAEAYPDIFEADFTENVIARGDDWAVDESNVSPDTIHNPFDQNSIDYEIVAEFIADEQQMVNAIFYGSEDAEDSLIFIETEKGDKTWIELWSALEIDESDIEPL